MDRAATYMHASRLRGRLKPYIGNVDRPDRHKYGFAVYQALRIIFIVTVK
jgi:hypothetical protein